MPRDALTAERRLDTAMRCKKPDRVPTAPLIHYFAAACAGYSCADLWWSRKRYRAAMLSCYRSVGPWDAAYLLDAASPEAYTWMVPMKIKVPGRELPDDSPVQFLEIPIMQRKDYEWMLKRYKGGEKLAFLKLLTKLVIRASRPVLDGRRGMLRLAKDGLLQALYYRQNAKMWKKLGVAMYYGGGLEAPFDTFSCARSIEPFVDDLMEVPDLVAEASMAAVPSYVAAARASMRVTGVNRFMVLCHRSSNDLISPRMFKDLALPSLAKICLKLARRDILTALHLDGNWDKNMELLECLPEGYCTLQLDGASDIFRARSILGNYVSILGDVPPLMLCMAAPEEIDSYCRRLIEEVGKEGAFTLGAGCEIPFNAKPENVKVMLRTAEKYGRY